MPRIPDTNPYQVREAAAPDTRMRLNVSREALGGGQQAQEVFKASSQLAQLSEKVKNDADDMNVRDADLAAAQLQNEIEQQVKNMRGKNSAGAPDYVVKNWEKGLGDIEKTLVNDEQRAKFDAIKKARLITLDTVANRHMGDEMRKYDDEQTSAYIKTAQDDAMANYKDPERISISIMQQEKAINEHADRHGVSDEVRQMNVAEAKSKTHYGIISRLVNSGEDMSGSNYFKQISDQMTGADRAAAEKILEEGMLRGEAQRKSDALYDKHPDDMKAALESAYQIDDPKLQDEVVTRVKQRFNDAKSAERMSVEDLHRRATDILDQSMDVDKIPREDWAQFSLSERSALKSYAKSLKDGGDVETDFQVYYDLRNMASGSQALKEKFMRLNLADPKYLTKLDKGARKEMVDLQAALRNGKGEADKILDGYRSDASIVNDSLSAAGIDPSPKQGSKDAARVAQFRAMVDDAIKQRQNETGKKITNDEVQGIVDRLLTKGTVAGSGIFGWFKQERRLYEAGKGDKLEIGVDDIPIRERRRIEDALRANGLPVNEDTIFELYRRKALKDAAQ